MITGGAGAIPICLRALLRFMFGRRIGTTVGRTAASQRHQQTPYSTHNLPYPRVRCGGAVLCAQRRVLNLRWIIA